MLQYQSFMLSLHCEIGCYIFEMGDSKRSFWCQKKGKETWKETPLADISWCSCSTQSSTPDFSITVLSFIGPGHLPLNKSAVQESKIPINALPVTVFCNLKT